MHLRLPNEPRAAQSTAANATGEGALNTSAASIFLHIFFCLLPLSCRLQSFVLLLWAHCDAAAHRPLGGRAALLLTETLTTVLGREADGYHHIASHVDPGSPLKVYVSFWTHRLSLLPVNSKVLHPKALSRASLPASIGPRRAQEIHSVVLLACDQ